MSGIKKIIDANLCLGCGLCEGIYGEENVEMKLNNQGYFTPIVKKNIDENIVLSICPSINVLNDQKFDKKDKIWGKVLKTYSAYSISEEIRLKGSSGGIITTVAKYLVESNKVDAILQVGGDRSDYIKNRLKISKNDKDIISCAKSRYAPALIFNEINDILKLNKDRYCFIGKPCDISGLKNFFKKFPEHKNRFIFFISIICAGMPSFNATEKVIDSFKNVKKPVKNLDYRGNGWPGYFSFKDSLNTEFKMSYNDSWGNILGKNIHFRCKICPDGIGLQADLAVGDAWETKDGYPDFIEGDGKSLVFLRTMKSIEIFDEMRRGNQLECEELPIDKIKNIQPFQYNRRQYVAARVLAASLINLRYFRFYNTRIWLNLLIMPFHKNLREFLGTIKRLL